MFSEAEMQLIRANCLHEFEELLKRLSIPTPAWNAKDEFKIYDDVDADLTDRICKLMKSETPYDGYTNLLKLGSVPYDYSEAYNQLLGMVVANKDRILRGLERMPKYVEVEEETVEPPPPPSEPKMRTITKEEHFTLRGPIILGVLLIVAGLACMFALGFVGGAIVAVLGAISIGLGVRGKTVKTTTTVPVTDNSLSPQPVRKSSRVRKEVKPPFTRSELQKTLDVLTQVDKIVRAI